ncbi:MULTISPECIES: ABC transporter permease subunit [Planococcus]|uniref:ABC transporter permease n=2 Tax=Planococcus TaxID=1372 RepID=A0ABM5WTJ8_9BACL|nr:MULTISPECIES: ABC transporter permease subunit [Planococcus]ALS77575.1 ABC transporter permease [Planococcus kocurii]AQU80543.1 ABC transporter permease [Planococcus faecalis]MDJ0330166.1 ABC transporter permease subunit [Planococcus sp. S3-L1]
MKQFLILTQKECLENIRNYKIFWIPAVFILLGITEPVVNYFLPQILESSGGLPDGAVLELPTLMPEQLLIAVMEQFQTIGIAVLILAYMGSIAGERKSGTATLLYVRPLSFSAYFLSKWSVASVVSLVSVWLGFLAGYYYTFLFFGEVGFGKLVQLMGTYSIWVVLILTIVLAASAVSPNGGIAAAVAFAIYLILQLTDSLFGTTWSISPVKIPQYGAAWLTGSSDGGSLVGAIGIAILCIFLLSVLGSVAARKNKAKTKV